MKQRKIPVGISVSPELLKEIDRRRRGLPRSIYVRFLLQKALEKKPKEKEVQK